jgi:hypothetical protein
VSILQETRPTATQTNKQTGGQTEAIANPHSRYSLCLQAHSGPILSIVFIEKMSVFAVGTSRGEVVLWTTHAAPFAAFEQTSIWPIHTVSVHSPEPRPNATAADMTVNESVQLAADDDEVMRVL